MLLDHPRERGVYTWVDIAAGRVDEALNARWASLPRRVLVLSDPLAGVETERKPTPRDRLLFRRHMRRWKRSVTRVGPALGVKGRKLS